MTGKSHLIAGSCALIHVWGIDTWIGRKHPPVLTPLWETMEAVCAPNGALLLCLGAFYLGTLFPDADTKQSILGRFLYIPVKHRTWLHAVYLYAVCLVLGFFFHPAFAWFAFGAIVHLFWDSFSVMGNCWFYKLFSDYREYPGGAKVKKGSHLSLYRTGEWTEYLLIFFLMATCVMIFLFLYK